MNLRSHIKIIIKDDHITIDMILYDIDHTHNFWKYQYTIILSDVLWLWNENRIMELSFYHNYSVAAVLKTLQLPVSCTSDISVYSLDMC